MVIMNIFSYNTQCGLRVTNHSMAYMLKRAEMEYIMENTIRKIEELSLNAHPALNTLFYDNWMLHFSKSYTQRANSVWMMNASAIQLEKKIAFCEEAYRNYGLPTIFKVTPLSSEVDMLLESRGYEIITPTNIMCAEIKSIDTSRLSYDVTIENTVEKPWEDNYFRLTGTSEIYQSTAREIHKKIIPRVLCATVFEGDEAVACGMAVVEQEYAGLYDIIVSPNHRRKGYGESVCRALLHKSAEYGAKKSYLQVVDANDKAKLLYRKLGFVTLYQYKYRNRPIQDTTEMVML